MKSCIINFSPALKRYLRYGLILLKLITLSVVSTYAQVGSLNIVPQPIAPDAAALGKYVEMPVSNFSGLPEISIPLYEYKAKSIDIPISLSYHASGIKVRDIPSTVGSGWALNAGGVITRIVKGYTDGNDLSHPNVYKAGLETMGQPGGQPYPDYRSMQGVDSEYINGDNNKTDTEFDIFYFNFMGYSGRFTFDKNGQIVILTASSLKAVYNYSGSLFTAGYFVLTDGDGVVYTFNQLERTPNSDIPSINSWYLSNISGPVRKESIDFKYREYGYGIYRSDYGKYGWYERIRYQDKSSHEATIPDQVFNPTCSVDQITGTIQNTISNTGGIILDRIGFGSDTIRFYHDTSRADVYKVKLDSIKVFQGATAIHAVKFTYGYNLTGSDPLAKKLLLNTVKINDQSPYTFSYYDSYLGKKMPGMLAKGEDLWGFYNGEDFPEKPTGEYGPPRFRSLVYGQTDNGWNSSYRNPDYRYAQLGSLKSLTYPTGGRTELDYEGNDFTNGFTGGPPENDLSIMLLLDSIRTNGIVAATAPGNSYPSGLVKSKEIMLHEDQTVTVSTSLGLSWDIDNVAKYNTYIYHGGAGYASTVKLYKFNSVTGVFDLVESRSYNPVTAMGHPANDQAFYDARYSYGTSAETHPLTLTEGRYKVESTIPANAYGLTAEIDISNSFKYRTYISGSGSSRVFKYNAGGIRLKKLRFISPVNSSSFEKTYEYTDGNISSGWLESPLSNVTSTMYWGERRTGAASLPNCIQLCNFYYFHYDNVIPLGNAQGGAIGYSKVTEKMSDGRKKIMYFSIPADGYNRDYLGSVIITDRVINDNSEYRGILMYSDEYNSNNQKIRSESHNLVKSRSFAVKNMYAKLANLYSGFCYTTGGTPNNLGQTFSNYYHYKSRLSRGNDVITYYNGTDTLTEITKRIYTAGDYNYPSTVVRYSSSGDSTVTRHKYPYEFNTISAPVTNSYAKSLTNRIALNIISQPVESYTTRYLSGVPKVAEAQLVSFNQNVYLPDTVFSLVNKNGLTDFAPVTITGSTITKDSRYKPKLLFTQFNKGNVVEQSKDGELKEVLLWGYNHSQIVARVTSSDYNTVRALVDTTVINNPPSDAALRTELAKIRTNLAATNPKATVTSYTYALLKGITSMTDPRGETTYDEYDSYGKLKRRKDADNAIKENLWYNYKP